MNNALPDMERLLQDSFYASAWEEYPSMYAMQQAGYFNDGLSEPLKFDVRQRVTPLPPFTEPAEKEVVLLITGGFAPIHDGHLAMMDKAYELITQKGYKVLGGYVSPSHDDYVQTKPSMGEEWSSVNRVFLAELALDEHPWLLVDPWESCYAPCNLNFTDVIRRLKAYLHFNLGRPVEVVYVFGADNAWFCRAFIRDGMAVCVERPGFPTHGVSKETAIANASNRIFFAKTETEISSRIIRTQTDVIPQGLPKALHNIWHRPRFGNKRQAILNYVIRDDLDWSLGRFPVNVELLQSKKEEFFLDLSLALESGLHPYRVEMKRVNLEEQEKVLNNFSSPILNMDMCTNAGFHINACRIFEMSGGQVRSHRFGSRPGYPSVGEQLLSVPAGQYALIDDDIATGYSMNRIVAALPAAIKIISRHSLLSMIGVDSENLYDMVDARDFLLGAPDAGLVVQNADKILRVPYMLPYVRLSYRARINPATEKAVSRLLWEANARFYKDLPLTIENTSPEQQKFWVSLGFSIRMPLSDLATWHANWLK